MYDIEELAEEPSKGKRSVGPKVMRWCVTWNNPNVTGDEVAERLNASDKVKGYVFQLEKGESGTPHFQMYIEFTGQVYAAGVRKTIKHEGVSTFRCNGTKAQNVKYCTKDDDRLGGPWIHGTCANESAGQGKRSDLDDFAKEVIVAGGVNVELIEKYGGCAVRYTKQAQFMMQQIQFEKAAAVDRAYWKEQVRLKAAGLPYGQKPRKLVLYFGPSAVGKTTEAKIRCESEYDEAPYMKQGTTKWWCGHNLEKCVIVDEWQIGMTGTLESFNDLTNFGTHRAETKGGQTPIIAECMMFTSNRHPIDIFKTKWGDARYRALARRFEEVHWWNDNKQLSILKNPGKEPVYMGDEPSEEWLQWNVCNSDWEYFWRGRTLREGDQIIHHTDGRVEEIINSYFTW
ncbi:replication-associated protein [Sewage-associated circular DNA virus-31]|uniref:replication-associated protein n=1 Tax=Sewage-associated circular DNA virus-31 TaxID=1592098 RepID=UPI000585EA51|nr:replication-associated protein [Sewage-associated circular DNA virus-31]AJD07558.1 replication-associated protein [Sewage-associated circular DNA virus-31]